MKSLERKLKGICPPIIKSFLIYILTHRFVGKLIRFSGVNWSILGGRYDYGLLSDRLVSRVFFGVHESAEVRFSKRYATESTIVEVGCSVGIILGALAAKATGKRFICIEPSKKNIVGLKGLVKVLPSTNRYEIVEVAISVSDDGKVPFLEPLDSVTAGHLPMMQPINNESFKRKSTVYDVNTARLSTVLGTLNVDESFCLIMDAEGAEGAVICKDDESLAHCSTIIIELADSSFGTIAEQTAKLAEIGFEILDEYYNVKVFQRRLQRQSLPKET